MKKICDSVALRCRYRYEIENSSIQTAQARSTLRPGVTQDSSVISVADREGSNTTLTRAASLSHVFRRWNGSERIMSR